MNRRRMFMGMATAAVLAIPAGYYILNDDGSTENKDNTIIKEDTLVEKGNDSLAKSNTFLVISDPHLRSDYTQSEVNNTGEADTGSDLWKISLDKFKHLISGTSGPKPDYVILLGDLPWHAFPTDKTDLNSARHNSGIVLTELRTAAQNANVPLIYAPGNNDSWSGDYRAFTAPNGETPFDLDKQGAKDWPVINSGTCSTNGTIACIADNTYANLGCYAVYPLGKKGGIRLVILNSVMFKKAHSSDRRLHHYGKRGEQQQDIIDQLTWLEKQFTEGNTNDAIMIGMHIPPGIDGYGRSEIWNTDLLYNGMTVKDAFLDIIKRHKGRIVGAITSHTHLDGIRKMMHYDTNNKLQYSDLIVSIPAITPRNGNNPSMKLFSYDPKNNHEWMNFQTINHSYWPYKTVGSKWVEGDLVSFNDAFKGDTSVPISKRVAAMDSLSLLSAVTKIYKAGGNSADQDTVAVTIEVTPDN